MQALRAPRAAALRVVCMLRELLSRKRCDPEPAVLAVCVQLEMVQCVSGGALGDAAALFMATSAHGAVARGALCSCGWHVLPEVSDIPPGTNGRRCLSFATALSTIALHATRPLQTQNQPVGMK